MTNSPKSKCCGEMKALVSVLYLIAFLMSSGITLFQLIVGKPCDHAFVVSLLFLILLTILVKS